MRAEPNPQPFFGDAVGPWHDHFAWLPIRTYEQQLVWLRWVRRRSVRGGTAIWFQYHAEPVEVLS